MPLIFKQTNAAEKLSEKKKIQFTFRFDAIADSAWHHWHAILFFFFMIVLPLVKLCLQLFPRDFYISMSRVQSLSLRVILWVQSTVWKMRWKKNKNKMDGWLCCLVTYDCYLARDFPLIRRFNGKHLIE